jgi:hypothetical protein
MEFAGTYSPREGIADPVASLLSTWGGDRKSARLDLKYCGPPMRFRRDAGALAALSEAFGIDLSGWRLP